MPPPQKPPTPQCRRSSLGLAAIILLILLLLLPGYALSRLAAKVDWRILTGVPVAASLVAFLTYRSDKRRAEAGKWRISEATLHLIDLAGGWPGGFLAQRVFRHKTSKAFFQVTFWAIILVHQFAAFDSLNDWQFSKKAIHFIQSHTVNRRASLNGDGTAAGDWANYFTGAGTLINPNAESRTPKAWTPWWGLIMEETPVESTSFGEFSIFAHAFVSRTSKMSFLRETRIPNSEYLFIAATCFSDFGVRHSFGPRSSDFGFPPGC